MIIISLNFTVLEIYLLYNLYNRFHGMFSELFPANLINYNTLMTEESILRNPETYKCETKYLKFQLYKILQIMSK